MLHSISQQIWKTAVATGLEKFSFHFNPREGQAKECSNCCAVALILRASKVMLISIKLGLSSMWMENFQVYRPDLEKAEESEVKLPAFTRSCRKQGNSRKTSTSSLTMMKPLTVWITANWKILKKRWDYQSTLPVSWEICMWVKKQQIELSMEQLTGSKLGKE